MKRSPPVRRPVVTAVLARTSPGCQPSAPLQASDTGAPRILAGQVVAGLRDRPKSGGWLTPRSKYRRSPLAVAVALLAAAALAGCAQAQSAANRAEKEAFCLKWRAVKEVTARADSPAALWALDKARSGLRGAVPEQQRAQLDRVLEAARAYAKQAQDSAGTLDDQAIAAARDQANKGYAKAVAGLNSYCQGSLTG